MTDILSLRMNEFGLSRIHFFGSDEDVFPYRIHVVRWEKTEPMEMYSITEKKYVVRDSYCYAIAELSWDSRNYCWDFSSIGTRYLEYATPELNKWLLDICNRYEINDIGELEEVEK